MDANTAYEIKAEAFHRMTGLMAPGKDEGMLSGNVHTIEERIARWNTWMSLYGPVINAMLRATESVCGV